MTTRLLNLKKKILQLEKIKIEINQIKDINKKQELLERVNKNLELLKFDYNVLVGKQELYIDLLEERGYKPFRTLFLQEQRLGMEWLNEQFNNLENDFEKNLQEETDKQIEKILKQIEIILITQSFLDLISLKFRIKQKTRNEILDLIKKSYNTGKTSIIKELSKIVDKKIDRPPTSKEVLQLMKIDANNITDFYINELEKTTKEYTQNAIWKNVSKVVIINNLRTQLKDLSSKIIKNISGTITGQYINRGRLDVAIKRQEIIAYKRSEVLDNKTCNICLSLDKRVILPTDPMLNLDIVHTHCRGVWLPIFNTDPKEKITNIPKTIQQRFEIIDGKPFVNKFKQLKKPIVPKRNKDAYKEMQKRINKKK